MNGRTKPARLEAAQAEMRAGMLGMEEREAQRRDRIARGAVLRPLELVREAALAAEETYNHALAARIRQVLFETGTGEEKDQEGPETHVRLPRQFFYELIRLLEQLEIEEFDRRDLDARGYATGVAIPLTPSELIRRVAVAEIAEIRQSLARHGRNVGVY